MSNKGKTVGGRYNRNQLDWNEEGLKEEWKSFKKQGEKSIQAINKTFIGS